MSDGFVLDLAANPHPALRRLARQAKQQVVVDDWHTAYWRGVIDAMAAVEWASPVWYDIREMATLNPGSGAEDADERHICPLQLPLIERAVRLWSNPGELVLSPFAGIGSEGYVAIQHGRRFVGVELKSTYWATAVDNLRQAEAAAALPTLFDASNEIPPGVAQ